MLATWRSKIAAKRRGSAAEEPITSASVGLEFIISSWPLVGSGSVLPERPAVDRDTGLGSLLRTEKVSKAA